MTLSVSELAVPQPLASSLHAMTVVAAVGQENALYTTMRVSNEAAPQVEIVAVPVQSAT